ncbi:SCP-like protein [Ancylostoma caninum]|uniref:SCP-like protein n=1 Tax=Ancylostoma caninum TaxID=29170 RepID=A0A368FQU0_ANCCA|nr:SCP-like protein [Ancylostoma caninum]
MREKCRLDREKYATTSCINLYYNCTNGIQITACPGDPNNPFTAQERGEIIDEHNKLRKTIAEGRHPNYAGTLPSAKNMYKLNYDCKMEKELTVEMNKCTGRATLSEQYGQNFLVLPTARFPGAQNAKATNVKFAMEIWTSPQKYYGLKNVSDYENNRLYTFANTKSE